MSDSWKIEYTYNSDGTLLSSKPSIWDGTAWYVPGVEWFYYDDNKNCIKWEHKTPSGSRVTNKHLYEYDTDYIVEQLVLPVNPEDGAKTKSLVEMVNKPILEHWYTENDLGELIYVCYYIYDYEELGTMGVSNQNLFANNLRMFPNPATDQFTISSDKNIITAIDIVDTTGKVILKETNLNKKEADLNIANLQSGVYYIRSTTTKGINTQKLVVQ